MHEYSIVQALLERVDAEAGRRGATAVHKIAVRIGELSGVDVGLLLTAYDIVRVRTICERADLEVEAVPAAWQCPRCGQPVARGGLLRCASCARPAQLAAGGEILLDRIDMEVP
jgi:hydrogenase nickel incorporation protein HypA/HybF